MEAVGQESGRGRVQVMWVARARMTMQTQGMLWTQAPFLAQEDGMAMALDMYLGQFLKDQLRWVVEGALPESAKPEWLD